MPFVKKRLRSLSLLQNSVPTLSVILSEAKNPVPTLSVILSEAKNLLHNTASQGGKRFFASLRMTERVGRMTGSGLLQEA